MSITIHGYDWVIKDEYGDDDNVNIHCWGLDRDSNPYLLRFTDFNVYCYIELPLYVDGQFYVWNEDNSARFVENILNWRLKEHAPIESRFEMKNKLYYYRGDRKFPMIYVEFSSLNALRHCTNMLNNPIKTQEWGYIMCTVLESTSVNIVRKLLTNRNIRYSQWFTCEGTKVLEEDKISSEENEYIVKWQTMKIVPDDICKNWATNPGILAFDIECYSNNHRAMPDKYDARHVAYMISAIYKRQGDSKSIKRHGIVIGDCNHIPPEKLANCEIFQVNDELELVEAFAKIVNKTNPEILTGYNILSFDYPYLDHRIKRTIEGKWPNMSRLIDGKTTMESKNWKSGAYGFVTCNILMMEGRISVDLLPIIKRDYKLEKYTLDFVCKKFIGKTKFDKFNYQEMFVVYENLTSSRKGMKKLSRLLKEDPTLNENKEFNMRVFEMNVKYEQARADMTEVMEYCIQDSELVIELMEKLNVWVSLVEMSNIVGVTIVEIFTRGQQIRCMSQMYDLAHREGFVLDTRTAPNYKFSGGYVYEPIPGLYDNIICLDFSSLYPSIIRAYNICYTTLVPPELMDVVPDDDCNIIEFDQEEPLIEVKKQLGDGEVIDFYEGCEGENQEEKDIEIFKEIGKKKKKEIKTVTKSYRFKFYKKKEGLLPRLEGKLIAERKAVRRLEAQTKRELKPLEKTEAARIVLNEYLSGNIEVITREEAGIRTKKLSTSEVAVPPEVITASKRVLLFCQLLDSDFLKSIHEKDDKERVEFNIKKTDDDHKLEKLELQIAEVGTNKEELAKILNYLEETREERCELISTKKTLMVILDKRQLAIKVSANSFFGFLGIREGGKMPLLEGAMSITAMGRKLIGEVRIYIENKYGGKQIAGDTDSCRGTTPVLIRASNGAISYVQIKDLMKYTNSLNPEATHYTYSGYNPVNIEKVGNLVSNVSNVNINDYDNIVNIKEETKLIEPKRQLLPVPKKSIKTSTTSTSTSTTSTTSTPIISEVLITSIISQVLTTPVISETSIITKLKSRLKIIEEPKKSKQEFYNFNTYLEVWTEKGWSKIKYLMKHRNQKKLYRVLTHTGVVDVTEDHSLLNEESEEVTPNQLQKGMFLLHHDLPNIQYNNPNMTIEKAWAWGFFMAEGTCGTYDYSYGERSSWSVCNQNQDFLLRAQAAMRAAEPDYEFIIDPCMKSSAVDKLNARGKGESIQPLVEKYEKLFYVERSEYMTTNKATDLGIRFKKVPDEILMANNDIKRSFYEGWYAGDGDKTEGITGRFDIKGQIGAAGLYYICSALGYKVALNSEKTPEREIYRINLSKKQGNKPNIIKKIIELGVLDEDVFDIETENHHFAAGPGRMVVHNSVMMHLPFIKNSKECNYWGNRLAEEITGIPPGGKDCDGVIHPEGRKGLFPPPLGMEFEKAMRLLCLRKKKYAAYLIAKDGSFKTDDIMDKLGNIIGSKLSMLIRGIVLARRDNAKVLAKTYTSALNMVMNRETMDKGLCLLIDAVQDLLDNKVSIEDLSSIRELGANYKSDSYFLKVFSDRLKKEGQIVNPGDRLVFLVVKDPNARLLGEKMRLVDQYEESLKTDTPHEIDYIYYIEKVLMNPINQLFEVGFKDVIPHLQALSFKPSNRHKIINIDQPIKILLKLIEYGGNIQDYKVDACARIKHLNEPPKPRKMRLIIVNTNDDKNDDKNNNNLLITQSSKLTTTLKLKITNNRPLLSKEPISIKKESLLKNALSPPSSPSSLKILMPRLIKK